MKVWRLTFSTASVAADEEYFLRSSWPLCTAVRNKTVYALAGGLADHAVSSWYGTKGKLVNMDNNRAIRLLDLELGG